MYIMTKIIETDVYVFDTKQIYAKSNIIYPAPLLPEETRVKALGPNLNYNPVLDRRSDRSTKQ